MIQYWTQTLLYTSYHTLIVNGKELWGLAMHSHISNECNHISNEFITILVMNA
jgi:hypothetical protein